MNKFRVWCKDYNEWEKDEIVLGSKGQIYHYSDRRELRIIRPENHIVQFFTGLLDKNGKEIYEGDVLKYSRNYQESEGGQIDDDIDKIVFAAGCFYWGKEFLFEYLCDTTDLNGKVDLEIIGNIFENPELFAQ